MKKSYIQRQYARYENTQALHGFWDFDWIPGVGRKSNSAELRTIINQFSGQRVPQTISRNEANRLLAAASMMNRDFLEKLDEETEFFEKSRSKVFGAEGPVADRWLAIKNDYRRNLQDNLVFLRRQENQRL